MNIPRVGDRIRLDLMADDPEFGPDPDPIPVGTEGTVTFVTQGAHGPEVQVGVKWDIPSSLHLLLPYDEVTILSSSGVSVSGSFPAANRQEAPIPLTKERRVVDTESGSKQSLSFGSGLGLLFAEALAAWWRSLMKKSSPPQYPLVEVRYYLDESATTIGEDVGVIVYLEDCDDYVIIGLWGGDPSYVDNPVESPVAERTINSNDIIEVLLR